MSNEMAQNFTSLTPVADESPELLGAWFTRIRTSHGLDQRDIAHYLGLSLSIIQAIENNEFERLGPAVFARSYVSRYAQLLKLPEQTALERYQQQSGVAQEPPPLQVVHSARRQTRVRDLHGLFYLLLIVGIGWTAAQYLSEVEVDLGYFTRLWSDQARSNSATTAKPAATTPQVQYPFQTPPAASTAATAPTAAPAPPPPETPPATPSEPAPASATAAVEPPLLPLSPPDLELSPMPMVPGVNTATAAPVPAGSELGGAPRLVLEFSGDCWVEVKDSQGKVLANGLMRPNTTSQLSGVAPFTITLGNAPAARITLDGKTIDRAIYVPKRGTVSRFTLNPS